MALRNRVITSNEEDTVSWARSFATRLKPGDKIALIADLGGGKTTFTRGLFEGLKGDARYHVSSPTFALLNEYPVSGGVLRHIDLYRLEKPSDLMALDFESYIDSESDYLIVEWANKFPVFLDSYTYIININLKENDEREFVVQIKKGARNESVPL